MLIRSPALTEGVHGLAGPGDKAFGFCRADFNQEAGKFAAILHPEDRVRLEQTLQRAVEQGKGSCSYRVRHADGRYRRWFEEVRLLSSSKDDGAKLISCIARMTGRVPTPRLRERVRERLEGYLLAVVADAATTPKFMGVELTLRNSEERLNYALRGANDGLWDWDLATDAVYYSPRWKEMLGYADHEVENHLGAWTRLVHPGDRDAILKQAASFMAGLIPRYEVEFRMRHKAGHWVDILARATLVRDAVGRPLRMVGTHVDITARREAERQLRAMQAQLEQRVRDRTVELETAHNRVATLLQTAPVGIVIHAADGRILQSNATACKLLGLSEAEALGKPLEDPAWQFLRADGSPMPRSEFPVSQVLATRQRLTGQICGIQGGRLPEPAWVYVNADPSFDEQGQVAEVVVSFMDITDRQRLETSLRESEERLRLALIAANQGLYDLNLQTGDCVVSPEYASMLGYDPAVFRETNAAWIERLHPDDREVVAQNYQEYVAGLRPIYAVEFRQRTRDGAWKWIFSVGKIVSYSADGRPLRMLGIHMDITTRKQAETALRESEFKYRRLIETMRDAFVSVDMTGHILECNPAYEAMLGYSTAQLRQKTYIELTPECWYAHEARIVQDEVLPQGFSGVYEKEYRRADGTVFPVELRTVLIRDTAGEPSMMWAVIRDITTRKQAELALRDWNARLEQMVAQRTESLRVSEQRFRTLVEATFEGVMVSRQGVIVDCNEQLTAILGCPRERLIGRNLTDFLPPEWRERVMTRIRAGIEIHGEYEVITEDGRRRVVETNGRSPEGPEGQRLTAVHDITERKRMEAELAAQRRALIRFQRLAELSEVSAGVIHQIGQPLTAVLNNVTTAKALAARCSNPGCTALKAMLNSDDCLKQVQLTMTRLRALIHPERARRELKDLNAIVRDVAELIQKEADASGIVVVTTLAPGLPLVALDEVQINQVLINILRNACDAVAECDPDRRELRASTRVDEAGWLTVEVRDRGSGIPPANLERLFEPFFTTKPDGMGIGLPLSRRIVHAHGGSLAAENNQDGPGATFRLRLPLVNGGNA